MSIWLQGEFLAVCVLSQVEFFDAVGLQLFCSHCCLGLQLPWLLAAQDFPG